MMNFAIVTVAPLYNSIIDGFPRKAEHREFYPSQQGMFTLEPFQLQRILDISY